MAAPRRLQIFRMRAAIQGNHPREVVHEFVTDHHMVWSLNPLLRVWREDLGCESIGKTKRDGIVNTKISCCGPKQNGVSAGLRRRHDLVVEPPDDRSVGVFRANLMVESGSRIDASKIRFSVARSRHLPISRCRRQIRRPDVQTPTAMWGTYLPALFLCL